MKLERMESIVVGTRNGYSYSMCMENKNREFSPWVQQRQQKTTKWLIMIMIRAGGDVFLRESSFSCNAKRKRDRVQKENQIDRTETRPPAMPALNSTKKTPSFSAQTVRFTGIPSM